MLQTAMLVWKEMLVGSADAIEQASIAIFERSRGFLHVCLCYSEIT